MELTHFPLATFYCTLETFVPLLFFETNTRPLFTER